MKKIALIILNYNNFEDTINCIESVEKHNTAPVKIIVVDNGSTRQGAVDSLHGFLSNRYADSYRLIRENESSNKGDGAITHLSPVTFLVSPTNDGYARGNNKALRLIDCDEEIGDVLILNNDILFIEDMIPRLLSTREKLADCGILSPLLLCRDGKRIDINCARRPISVNGFICKNLFSYIRKMIGKNALTSDRYLLRPHVAPNGEILEIGLPSGSCMLIDKELFKRIGWFDPGTFLYFEEDILHSKMVSIGRKCYLDTSCRCIHLGAESSKKIAAPFIMRTNLNSELYYVKNFSSANTTTRMLHKFSVEFYWSIYRLQQSIKSSLSRLVK